MTSKERIFHAVFFEVVLLVIMISVASLATQESSGDLTIVGIFLSLLAVTWNYIYNVIFDKLFGAERIHRGLKLRVLHSVCFEAGFIVISVPVIAWFLGISLFAALMIDIGLFVVVLFYTLLFNWIYDLYQPYKNWFGVQKA
jgi:uncharacterized membrane protein